MENNCKMVSGIIRSTPIHLIFGIILITIVSDVIYTVAALVADAMETAGSESIISDINHNVIFRAILIVIQLGIIAYMITRRYSEYYLVESDYILHMTGIFAKRETIFKLDSIRSISVRKKFRGNVLQYGDIEVTTQGDSKTFTFESIPNPEQLIRSLEQTIENNNQKID